MNLLAGSSKATYRSAQAHDSDQCKISAYLRNDDRKGGDGYHRLDVFQSRHEHLCTTTLAVLCGGGGVPVKASWIPGDRQVCKANCQAHKAQYAECKPPTLVSAQMGCPCTLPPNSQLSLSTAQQHSSTVIPFEEVLHHMLHEKYKLTHVGGIKSSQGCACCRCQVQCPKSSTSVLLLIKVCCHALWCRTADLLVQVTERSYRIVHANHF